VNGKEKQFLGDLLKSVSFRFTYGAGLWRRKRNIGFYLRKGSLTLRNSGGTS
ncbi:unnamed protein product, partial [marine sediment metagenome]